MKPVEALQKAIEYSAWRDMDRDKPGAMVERMPQDVRDALKSLTSDDALNLRPDYIRKS